MLIDPLHFLCLLLHRKSLQVLGPLALHYAIVPIHHFVELEEVCDVILFLLDSVPERVEINLLDLSCFLFLGGSTEAEQDLSYLHE